MRFKGREPLYIQIADYYEKLISLGIYKEGNALPSVREVALAENLNPNTVVHAYNLMVEKGLIEAIPKKGYFVLPSSSSEENKAVIALKSLIAEGYTIEELEKALMTIKEEQHD